MMVPLYLMKQCAMVFSCENEEFQENAQQISGQTRCVRVKELILGRLWFCKTKFFKATKFCFFSVSAVVPSPTSKVFNAKKLWPGKISLPKSFLPELSQALLSKDSKLFIGRLRKAFVARIFEHFSVYTL